MELRQIRYFLAICEHGSFSRAAEACGLTQPALTKAIKGLEDEVGGAVFHREGRRLVLSELGRMIRPHLERLANEQEAALTVAKNFRLLKQTPLRVGILPTIGPARIGRFLREFGDANPGVEMAISEGAADSLARRLEAADLDLAIANPAAGFGDSYRSEPLYRERYVVVFAPGHPFARLDTIRLADVHQADYVDRLACEMRDTVMQVIGAREIELYAKFRSDREDWVQSMVLSGLGFAFMPEYSITATGLVSRPLVEPDVAREVHAIEVRGRPRPPAASLFLRALTTYGWE
ncbi:LysR family transcriptional regulator [Burkholderiaceae bacterium FT117]|uniref:LysR family transcriptional regulator n=1 Tax=Zeimonas sediminis TaxID=2944268 RepID=UPI002343025B|nr:LysR family transcriptional regulator [Zeimonas sediminis]MCM5571117.1 LysR family transcriptional regulator [Zeimonas sediminis]